MCGCGGRERMAFVEPLINRCANFVELAGEEVVSAFDEHEFFSRWQSGEKRFNISARAELIVATLDDQFWFRAVAQVSQV